MDHRKGEIWRVAITTVALALALIESPAFAEAPALYRAFWVDTFNTTLNNHDDVVAVIDNATAANANALFVQVRRRGDAWYLNSLEPLPDSTPIAAGFDPLQDVIEEAHKAGIEVHAFVIVGAVWNRNPATLGPPTSPTHVFNLHGGYDPTTQRIEPGPNNWLTRTLLPDGAGGISFQGHRFGNDFWIDLGHPHAEAYTVDVLMHLVRNHDIDGLHLDRIRYPEFSVSGQTPSTGTNIGYNETSVERFQRRNGISAGAPPPGQNDPLWSQWRRDQVTNLVRRVYLNAIAIKPQIKVSAALIAFGGGPTTEAAWSSAEAYWRVYQDWRAWTEEGILDLAIPMDYKREHTGTQAVQFDQWAEWLKNHQYRRAGLLGLGVFLNSVEGTLRQVRRALAPSLLDNTALGVTFFSMANSNAGVFFDPNSIPPFFQRPPAPKRSFEEFAAGLTTGHSVSVTTDQCNTSPPPLLCYENLAINPAPVFAEAASVPALSWKMNPTLGHVMGFARDGGASPLDTAAVAIENLDTHETRTTATDGGGFYGGVDLPPGAYRMQAASGAERLFSCIVQITPGAVTSADVGPETVPPTTEATVDPPAPDGANGWYTTDVLVSLAATDACAGVARTEYSLGGGATWTTYAEPFTITAEGETTVRFRSADAAGNVETPRSFIVKIDKTDPTIELGAAPGVLWPPDGRDVDVTLAGSGADAISGLAAVSYTVVDEYGMPLGVPVRSLAGAAAAEWTDTLALQARRTGDDGDGRLYRITATISDRAGRTSSATADVVVPHDRR